MTSCVTSVMYVTSVMFVISAICVTSVMPVTSVMYVSPVSCPSPVSCLCHQCHVHHQCHVCVTSVMPMSPVSCLCHLQAEIKELKEQIQMFESASQFLPGAATFPTPPHFDDSYMQLGIKTAPQPGSPASR